MDIRTLGAIDCDIHPAVPSFQSLMPYLSDYWRESLVTRGTDRLPLDLTMNPTGAPISCRPDWRPETGVPGGDFARLRRDALDHFGTRYAICNVIHGALGLFQPYMAAAMCGAINDWVARELMDNDPRLRASIVIPAQEPELAVEEIERLAHDHRFVQVFMLAMGDMPLGRRHFWPIYAAAERHGLPICVHAGSSYRWAPTPNGWSSYFLQDYVAYGCGFDNVVLSMVSEGVFEKFPELMVVMTESGVSWLPACLWRFTKTWRGVRLETPWVRKPPFEYVRRNMRMTLQPFDAPPDPGSLEILIEQLGSDDMLLFSTDYPHWQFDGDDALPAGINPTLARKILVDNPLATYPRLAKTAAGEQARKP